MSEIQQLREQIAHTVARRDALKTAIELNRIAPREGFRELDILDARLSDLDTRFKRLWDAGCNEPAPPPRS